MLCYSIGWCLNFSEEEDVESSSNYDVGFRECGPICDYPASSALLQIDFIATNFNPEGGPAGDTISGSFLGDFDLTTDNTGSLISGSITIGGTVYDGTNSGYSYQTLGDLLALGGNVISPANCCLLGADDWRLAIININSITPNFSGFLYTSVLDPNNEYRSFNVTGSISPVPLPAALPLFLTMLAGMGLLRWWKRRVA